MRTARRFISLALLLLVCGAAPAFAQLDGDYEVIGTVPEKHSLDAVQVEEFLNFTCPHCNNFREASKSLHSKYGKRLRLTAVPILFRGQSDLPLRLYFVGERLGRADEMKELIFDATFRYGVNINDPQIVGFLARSAGLADEFAKQADADWVNDKIRLAHVRADQFGVEATPTLVLNGALRLVPRAGMQAFVSNLDHLLEQLLKTQS